MRKELFYLGLMIIVVMFFITLFFETTHPDRGLDELQMQGATFVEHINNKADSPSAESHIATAQKDGTTVLQEGISSMQSFTRDIKKDILGE